MVFKEITPVYTENHKNHEKYSDVSMQMKWRGHVARIE
jgi:hypothetical protein